MSEHDGGGTDTAGTADTARAAETDGAAETNGAADTDGVTGTADTDETGTADTGVTDTAESDTADTGTAQDTDTADDAAVTAALPDVSGDTELESALEALLLVVDSPATEEVLADAVGQPQARVRTALRRMSEALTERGSGIDLRHSGEGWRFFTRETYAPFVEKLMLDGQRSKLTRAALETLAVVAYRQPVTRSRVAAVRGVNVDGVVRTLLARGLVEEAGADEETGGTLYVTTELFLERLGVSSLGELPPIAPLLPEADALDDA